ncbi:MAG: hypothetical protein KKB20_01205 [Proteobacteria bacterium]|nr:hypothetical protein [Pseudomonadota bacterium]
MNGPEVRFEAWLSQGFNLYKNNFMVLLLASVLAVLLGSITGGILAGPMAAGLILIALGLLDGVVPPPQAGDVFKGFGWFLQSFLFVFLWGLALLIVWLILNIIPIIGHLLSLALYLAAEALLMFGLFLIVEQNMPFWAAGMASIAMVRSNFWPFMGFGVLAAVIGGIGSILCGLGVVLTLPIQICMVAVAYRDVFGGSAYDVPSASESGWTPPETESDPHSEPD